MGGKPKGLRPRAHALIPNSRRLVPERLLPDGVEEALVASPDGTGQNVETGVLPADAREEFVHLCRIRVIDPDRYAKAATARYFFGGVLDGSGRRIDGFGSGARRAACDVDGSACVAQRERDAATATSAGPGHDSNFTVQRGKHTSRISLKTVPKNTAKS